VASEDGSDAVLPGFEALLREPLTFKLSADGGGPQVSGDAITSEFAAEAGQKLLTATVGHALPALGACELRRNIEALKLA
jgi:hypothetical protein